MLIPLCFLFLVLRMPTDPGQWRDDIGLLYVSRGWYVSRPPSSLCTGSNKSYKHQRLQRGGNTLLLLVVCFVVVPMLLVMAGDVELNPGPEGKIKSVNCGYVMHAVGINSFPSDTTTKSSLHASILSTIPYNQGLS